MSKRGVAGAAAAAVAVVALTAAVWGWVVSGRRAPSALVLPGVVEIQEVRLGSKVGGRVEAVLTAEGKLVEPKARLVTFQAPELKAQRDQWRARLRADEAAHRKAVNGPRKEEKDALRAALDAAEARWKRIVAGYREEEIRQVRNDFAAAEADVLTARADLKFAEEELGRASRLFERRTVPQADLDSARAAYDRAHGRAQSAAGRLSAARAQLDLVTAGSRPEDKAEAAALLSQARANLELALAGSRVEDVDTLQARVDETRAKLDELEANLAESDVFAPDYPCVVDVIAVRPGDLVAAGQTVVRVLRASDWWVKVFVPETELGKVRLGQTADVTVDAYPGRRFAGEVVYVASQSEFTPRNVQSVDERRHQVFAVKVRVDDPGGVYKSGMAAQVTLPLAPPTGATP